MPIHDWSIIPAGLFHHFHQDWSTEITRELNRGRLPKGLSALIEQRAGPKEPHILILSIEEYRTGSQKENTELSVATLERPSTQFIRRTSKQIYAKRANRIVIRHRLGRIVAVIEIISPGNKESRAALQDFVEKTIDLLRKGINVLIIDLFPPTREILSGFTRRFGMRLQRKTLSSPMVKTARWFLTTPVRKKLPTSKLFASATLFRTCRSLSTPICT
jgi:hypothetical protein